MKLANLETFIDIDHVYVDFSFRITRIRTIIAAENNCDWSRQNICLEVWVRKMGMDSWLSWESHVFKARLGCDWIWFGIPTSTREPPLTLAMQISYEISLSAMRFGVEP